MSSILEEVVEFLIANGPTIAAEVKALWPATLKLIQDIMNSGQLTDADYVALESIVTAADVQFESDTQKWQEGPSPVAPPNDEGNGE